MVNTMNLLWAFKYEPEIDSTTKKAIPINTFDYSEVRDQFYIMLQQYKIRVEQGAATGPKPFMCTITPRSKQHAEIIKHNFSAAEAAFAPYEHGLREEDRAFIEARRKEL